MAKKQKRAPEGLEERYERYRGILKDLTIMSDMFMRNVFKKRECTEYVLQVVMDKKDLKVIDQVLAEGLQEFAGAIQRFWTACARDSEGQADGCGNPAGE